MREQVHRFGVSRELEAPLDFRRIRRKLAQCRLVRAKRPHLLGDSRAELLVPAEQVEHVALPRGLEQPLLLVLAVDLDEGPYDRGETGCCH